MIEQLKVLVVALTMLQTSLAAVPQTPVQTNEIKNQAVVVEAQTDPRIEKLIQCESGNRWDIKTVDTNGFYSYGGLQFQLSTFLRYGKQYGVISTSTTQDEGRVLIFREDLQRAIATKMLQEPDGWKNWTNCWRKINGSQTNR